ncbi:hypothetical protein PUNSTDRAFT_143638 [Punctularia strigosozonata HHB-11173 SS5]|uniref:uncharacterized protein n=1 Tax=Punctularia strigosozonata (strain HHB-11173) TaxID=741275 RepID=UPI0004416993|nr:uncharacterized protein PUNSTDRAFT_143638 [Punctularia strigosozonata HHB-11173 SS5]EIN09001.1 hypothetical protein PUNSTDRAFT_143638 [Punctularia strigosozonata HHB-11173 SS5]
MAKSGMPDPSGFGSGSCSTSVDAHVQVAEQLIAELDTMARSTHIDELRTAIKDMQDMVLAARDAANRASQCRKVCMRWYELIKAAVMSCPPEPNQEIMDCIARIHKELQQSRTDLCKVASREPSTGLSLRRLTNSTSDEFLMSRTEERVDYSIKLAQKAELFPPEYSMPVPKLEPWNYHLSKNPDLLMRSALWWFG